MKYRVPTVSDKLYYLITNYLTKIGGIAWGGEYNNYWDNGGCQPAPQGSVTVEPAPSSGGGCGATPSPVQTGPAQGCNNGGGGGGGGAVCSNQLNQIYNQYLGRCADVSGQSTWTGQCINQVIAGITGSAEYAGRGTPVSSGGCGNIRAVASPMQMAIQGGGGGGGCAPLTAEQVNQVFRQQLGRCADASGKATFTGKTLAEVLSGITGSAEYVASHPCAAAVSTCFQSSMNYAPSWLDPKDYAANGFNAQGVKVCTVSKDSSPTAKALAGAKLISCIPGDDVHPQGTGVYLLPNGSQVIVCRASNEMTSATAPLSTYGKPCMTNKGYRGYTYTSSSLGCMNNPTPCQTICINGAKVPFLNKEYLVDPTKGAPVLRKCGAPITICEVSPLKSATGGFDQFMQSAIPMLAALVVSAVSSGTVDLEPEVTAMIAEDTASMSLQGLSQTQIAQILGQSYGISAEAAAAAAAAGTAGAETVASTAATTAAPALETAATTAAPALETAATTAAPALETAATTAAPATTAATTAATPTSLLPSFSSCAIMAAAQKNALMGTLIGGVKGAMNGGCILKCAAFGGIAGGVGGGLGSWAGGFPGMVLGGAGAGAVGSALNKQCIAKGALFGGAGGALTGGLNQVGINGPLAAAITGGALSTAMGGNPLTGAITGAGGSFLGSQLNTAMGGNNATPANIPYVGTTPSTTVTQNDVQAPLSQTSASIPTTVDTSTISGPTSPLSMTQTVFCSAAGPVCGNTGKFVTPEGGITYDVGNKGIVTLNPDGSVKLVNFDGTTQTLPPGNEATAAVLNAQKYNDQLFKDQYYGSLPTNDSYVPDIGSAAEFRSSGVMSPGLATTCAPFGPGTLAGPLGTPSYSLNRCEPFMQSVQLKSNEPTLSTDETMRFQGYYDPTWPGIDINDPNTWRPINAPDAGGGLSTTPYNQPGLSPSGSETPKSKIGDLEPSTSTAAPSESKLTLDEVRNAAKTGDLPSQEEVNKALAEGKISKQQADIYTKVINEVKFDSTQTGGILASGPGGLSSAPSKVAGPLSGPPSATPGLGTIPSAGGPGTSTKPGCGPGRATGPGCGKGTSKKPGCGKGCGPEGCGPGGCGPGGCGPGGCGPTGCGPGKGPGKGPTGPGGPGTKVPVPPIPLKKPIIKKQAGFGNNPCFAVLHPVAKTLRGQQVKLGLGGYNIPMEAYQQQVFNPQSLQQIQNAATGGLMKTKKLKAGGASCSASCLPSGLHGSTMQGTQVALPMADAYSIPTEAYVAPFFNPQSLQQIQNAKCGGSIEHMASGGFPAAQGLMHGRQTGFNHPFQGLNPLSASFTNLAPLSRAKGGDVHNPQFYSEGGLNNTYVKGEGDGTSDSIPAMLANGEFVIPADVVSSLGNGSNDSGAKVLDELLKTIRSHKRKADAKHLPPDSKGALGYLLEAKKKAKK